MTAIITPTRWGPFLVPPYDVYVGQSMIRLGEFSAAEFETWRPYVPLGGCVFDVGANLGAHTIPFARCVGPNGVVVAVEPQRALAQMLGGTAQLCGTSNIQIVVAAADREPGELVIPRPNYLSQSNFGALEVRGHTDGEHTQVTTVDILAGPNAVDFIKIDVEGAELGVLHGAKETIARCRPVLAVEADREQNNPALLALLRLSGYRVWWHKPPLGPLFPGTISINLLALPREREELPLPVGDVEVAVE